ncbi:phosphatase PAP2 family protein [Bacillus carboniphilus]|uniref:Phosphatase PAP2 family protein n=1 Tax=Bacillus carboniphilus TaxID=86663 RepID=A0ABY9JSD8_9BACI|nr:phosphatase PAP2 family protein [Bacillus carboniphilus]WLR42311.1 phosphatase PAP2 family protein [Bacillus carboniphilus]
MKAFWIAFFSCISFTFLSVNVSNSPLPWDKPISSFLEPSQWLTLFDFLGSNKFVSIMGFILILYIWWKDKNYRKVIFIGSSLVLGYFAFKGLKILIGRERPLGALDEGNSFPSGQSTMSFIFFFLLCYVIRTEISNRSIRFLVYISSTLLVLFVGASRIVQGDHYASDVVGGYLTGLTITGGLLFLYEKWEIFRRDNDHSNGH